MEQFDSKASHSPGKERSQPGTHSAIGRWKVTYSWAIKSFSKLKRRIKTPYFPAHSNIPYKVILSLHDDLDNPDQFIVLSFNFKDNFSSPLKVTNRTAFLHYDFIGKNGIVLEDDIEEKREIWKNQNKATIKLNKMALVNAVKASGDELEIYCEITFSENEMPDGIKSRLVSSKNSCLANFNSMWINAQHADVTLKSSDGAELKAHRLILSARSPVFKALFINEMAEKKERLVEIKEFSASTLNHFLSYVYSGTLPDNAMTSDERMHLLVAAHRYDVKSLKDLLEQYLIHEVNIANADKIFQLSFLCDSKELKDSLLKFVCSHKGRSLLNTPHWNEMLREHPQGDVFSQCLLEKLENYDFISECQ